MLSTRWLVLGAAGIAFAAAHGFGRFGITLILPPMRDGLGLSNGEVGAIAGLGLAAYLLCSVPAGALVSRFGTRRVVVVGLLATAIGLAGTGLADGFASAVAAQAIVGAASPAIIVPMLAIGGAWSSPAFRGRATGLVVAGGGIGILGAGLLVPVLLGPDGGDWRSAWRGLALGVLAATLVAVLGLRDPPGVGDRGGLNTPRLGLVYRSWAVWRLGVAFGLYGVAFIVYGTFFAAHLSQRGVATAMAGWLWSLAGLVSIGSGLAGGMLTDRLGASRTLVVMFVVQGAGLALLAWGDAPGWYAGSAVLYGASLWGFPPAVSKACSEIVGPALAPAALGVLALLFGLGQTIGPIIGGLLADQTGTLSAALLLGAAADGAGVVWVLLLRQPAAAES